MTNLPGLVEDGRIASADPLELHLDRAPGGPLGRAPIEKKVGWPADLEDGLGFRCSGLGFANCFVSECKPCTIRMGSKPLFAAGSLPLVLYIRNTKDFYEPLFITERHTYAMHERASVTMNSSIDDLQLLNRIAKRDEAALRLLYGNYQVRVFRFVMRLMRNEAIAEELTNEVFMEVWRNAGKFEGRANVSTWILSIAHNRSVSKLRKKRDENWDEDDAMQIADHDDDPEIVAQKTDKGKLLRGCIDKLSEEHREIIDLAYYHEKSVSEISAIVGVPEATVKTRMFYARKRLSEILQHAGVDRGWP